MYSISPQMPAVDIVINHDRDIAVATSGFTPMSPKNNTNAPSLIPRPEIDKGNHGEQYNQRYEHEKRQKRYVLSKTFRKDAD